MKCKYQERTIKTSKLLSKLSDEFQRMSAYVTDKALLVEDLTEDDKKNIAPNGKRYRTYNKAELYQDLEIRKGSTKLDKLVKKFNINTTRNGVWRVNLLDRNRLKQILGKYQPFIRTKKQNLAIFVIANLKGGSCKTTTTSLISSGLAIDALKQLRIGVIDLDPQGTLTRIYQPKLMVSNPKATYNSIGDLLIDGRVNLNETTTFSQTCRDSFLETNYPNLKILPANCSDVDFELDSRLQTFKGDKDHASYKSLQKVIDNIKDDFDVIFIDTPPALNEISIAAHFVATHILIPLKASENDRDSTAKYLYQFSNLYKYMANIGHKGYYSINFIPSAVNFNSRTELRIENTYEVICGDLILKSIPTSEAIKNTSEDLNTLFDISPSDYNGSLSSIKQAQLHVKPLIARLESMLNDYWGIK